MAKTRKNPEDRILRALQHVAAGKATIEATCLNLGISRSTFYAWRRKYGDTPAPKDEPVKSTEAAEEVVTVVAARETYDEKLRKALRVIALLMLAVACAGLTYIVFLAIRLRVAEPAGDSLLFHLVVLTDVLPWVLFFLLLAGCLVALTLYKKKTLSQQGTLRVQDNWLCAAAVLIVLAYLPLRRIGVNVCRQPLINHAATMYDTADDRTRVARYATQLLEYIKDSEGRVALLFFLAKVQEERHNDHRALATLTRLFSLKPDYLPAANRKALFEDTMARIGARRSAAYCRFLYERFLRDLPGNALSPFSFFTDTDWSVIEAEWEIRRLGAEAQNRKLRGMLDYYPDHPDRPYVLYLLGDTETLLAAEGDSNVKRLAQFHVAARETTSEADAAALYARIVTSTSTQSFVDDAARRAGTFYLEQKRAAETLAVLLTGYGRGNRDMSPQIEQLVVAALALLSVEDGATALETAQTTPEASALRVYAYGALACRADVEGRPQEERQHLLERARTNLDAARTNLGAARNDPAIRTWCDGYGEALDRLEKQEPLANAPLARVRAIQESLAGIRTLLSGPSGEEAGAVDALAGEFLGRAFSALRATETISRGDYLEALGALHDHAVTHQQRALAGDIRETQLETLVNLAADPKLGALAQASCAALLWRDLEAGRVTYIQRAIDAARPKLTEHGAVVRITHAEALLQGVLAYCYRADPALFVAFARRSCSLYQKLIADGEGQAFGTDAAGMIGALEKDIRAVRDGTRSPEECTPPDRVQEILDAYAAYAADTGSAPRIFGVSADEMNRR